VSDGLRGCYPGSFDPPTLAHLHVAEVARARLGLATVTFVLSEVAIDKEHRATSGPTARQRAEVLERVGTRVPWLRVEVTPAQLVADLAAGYDAVVMGADKWAQVNDPRYYPDESALAAALARLPRVVVAPRGDLPVPDDLRLDVDDWAAQVSSTLARDGRRELMLPEAAASSLRA
jgi:hypothetical protein